MSVGKSNPTERIREGETEARVTRKKKMKVRDEEKEMKKETHREKEMIEA